ncbi:MAG: BrnT family toxin [Burkholderiales bacterium]
MISFAKQLGIEEHDFRVIFGRTKIEYDPDKEDSNRIKHGYSLASAIQPLERILFFSARPYLLHDSYIEKNEVRHKLMWPGDACEVLFMVTTMRPDETIRIISLRRANDEERKIFCDLTGYAASA